VSIRGGQLEAAAEHFYEALGAGEMLPAALQSLADASGSAGTLMTPVGIGVAPVPSLSFTDYAAEFDAAGWALSNSRMVRGMELTRAGRRGLITDIDMFTREELARDTYYNEWVRPHGMGATAGMVVARVGNELFLPMMLERRHVDGPFEPREIAVLNRLMALLRPAAEAALKLGLSSAASIADALGGRGCDIALLGGSGRIVHATPGFLRHVDHGLTLRHGVPGSSHPRVRDGLAAAVRRAIGRGSAIERVAPPVALPRPGRRPLIVRAVPVAGIAHDAFMLARALLIVSDPEDLGSADAVGAALASLGLSSAEIRLVQRLGRGEDLGVAADAEGITVETARGRLKSVFAKTGVNRQAGLAALVARLSR
jgi:DNA-binding CsgD family transcriptional regulator